MGTELLDLMSFFGSSGFSLQCFGVQLTLVELIQGIKKYLIVGARSRK